MTFDLSRRSDIVIAILSPLVLLSLWQIAVVSGFFDYRFVPAPLGIVGTLVDMIATGELWNHIGISLMRVGAGFTAGAGAGILVGLTMGIFRPVRAALTPIVASLFPIPKLAILPILILFFGIGETSKILIIATGVFFISLINTVSGVLNIDRIYLDVAKNLNVTGKDF
jgi:NitT/TauT family transport system permease protein